MSELLYDLIERYAEMVLEWLEIDSRHNDIPRQLLVEQFMDTLNALEQNKEQEDE